MQGDRRDWRSNAFRQRLLAGAALIACAPFATAAAAQSAQPAPAASGQAVSKQVVDDGLTPQALYIDADSATRQGDTITATGTAEDRVYARSRGHVLRGESLSYDLANGTATADGRVEAITPTARSSMPTISNSTAI